MVTLEIRGKLKSLEKGHSHKPSFSEVLSGLGALKIQLLKLKCLKKAQLSGGGWELH